MQADPAQPVMPAMTAAPVQQTQMDPGVVNNMMQMMDMMRQSMDMQRQIDVYKRQQQNSEQQQNKKHKETETIDFLQQLRLGIRKESTSIWQ